MPYQILKKIYFILISITSLLTGFSVYLIFRTNTYVSLLFTDFYFIIKIREIFSKTDSIFLNCYFADFLWALSLCSSLHSIFLPKTKGSLVCSIIVVIFGSFYELLQHLNILNGTGDVYDILMYTIAALTVNVINNFFKGE